MASTVQSALQMSEWPSIIINVLTNLTSYSSQAISHTSCSKKLLNWVISKLSQTWHKAVAWWLGFGLLRPQARPKLWAGCDFGWAWPGLFWPGLAFGLRLGHAHHYSSLNDACYMAGNSREISKFDWLLDSGTTSYIHMHHPWSLHQILPCWRNTKWGR